METRVWRQILLELPITAYSLMGLCVPLTVVVLGHSLAILLPWLHPPQYPFPSSQRSKTPVWTSQRDSCPPASTSGPFLLVTPPSTLPAPFPLPATWNLGFWLLRGKWCLVRSWDANLQSEGRWFLKALPLVGDISKDVPTFLCPVFFSPPFPPPRDSAVSQCF